MRKAYPSDLTDAQWALIEPVLPPAKPGGRPREVELREVVNTLFYQNRTGCQWDFLPHDLSPKGTAYDYFKRWGGDGTWQAILDALGDAFAPKPVARKPPVPPASIPRRSKAPRSAARWATTVARRSRDANAISWWIPWVC